MLPFFMLYGIITSSGGVAHLGERLNGIQKVVGSIPIISTSGKVQVLFPYRVLVYNTSCSTTKKTVRFAGCIFLTNL